MKRILATTFLLLTCTVNAKTVEKIVALSPHSVEIIYSLGLGKNIVATVEHADYPKAALKIPRVGNYTGVQIEQIVALQPDLIIGWKGGNRMSDLNKLESLGFDMFYTDPKNINGVVAEIKRLGKRLGVSESVLALAAVEKIESEYQSIKKQYKNKKTVSVFYQLFHEPLRTVGPGSWVESLIADCNGANIFNDANVLYPAVSMESVLARNPSVIIVASHSGSIEEGKIIWEKWNQINAIKNEKLFVLDGSLLHRTTPRAVEGLRSLCEKIDEAR